MSIQNHPGNTNFHNLGERELSKLTREGSDSPTIHHRPKDKGLSRSLEPSFYYGGIPMSKELPQWNCSSSTLRHTTKSFKFPRSSRFLTPKSSYQDGLKLQYPSSMGRRCTSLGFGKRNQIPEVFGNGKFKASQNCPFYQIDKESIQRSNSAMILGKGKTFGMSWRYYEAARAPQRSTVHSSYQQKSNPAPNHYDVLNPEGKNDSPKIQMHRRLEMFTTKNGSYRRNQPDPQTYEIKYTLVQSHHQRTTMFGFGDKTDFTKKRERTPGPIYKEKNFCDKFIQVKLKLHQI